MSPDRPNEPEDLTGAGEHDPRVSPGSELARLHDGYMLRYAASSKTLDLHAPDGQICVRLILGAQGAQVEISAASLAVRTDGDIGLRCQRFEVDAERGVDLRTGGDLTFTAGKALTTEGFEQRLVARRGDFSIIANDDVQLDGERILLNSPRPTLHR